MGHCGHKIINNRQALILGQLWICVDVMCEERIVTLSHSGHESGLLTQDRTHAPGVLCDFTGAAFASKLFFLLTCTLYLTWSSIVTFSCFFFSNNNIYYWSPKSHKTFFFYIFLCVQQCSRAACKELPFIFYPNIKKGRSNIWSDVETALFRCCRYLGLFVSVFDQ